MRYRAAQQRALRSRAFFRASPKPSPQRGLKRREDNNENRREK